MYIYLLLNSTCLLLSIGKWRVAATVQFALLFIESIFNKSLLFGTPILQTRYDSVFERVGTLLETTTFEIKWSMCAVEYPEISTRVVVRITKFFRGQRSEA